MQSINNSKIYQWILVTVLLTTLNNGYSSPASWDEITHPGFVPRRSQEQIQVYRNHLKGHFEQGRSPEQAVLMDIFRLSPDDIAKCVGNRCKQDLRLVVTSFPYWLENNIGHLLVFSNQSEWNLKELTNQTVDTLGEQLPELMDSEKYDYSIYINPPRSRSVPNLAHSHVFVRNRQQNSDIFSLLDGLPFSKPSTPPSSWIRQ